MTYTRSRSRSLTERLNYMGIRNGIVFSRTRGIETGVEFFLPTQAQVTDDMRDQLAAALRTVMVQGIRQRMRGRLIVECAPTNEKQMLQGEYGEIENDLLRLLINTERQQLNEARQNGQLSQWRYFFTVRLDTKQTRMAQSFAYLQNELETLMQRAEAIRDNLGSMLEAAGFSTRPLSSQEAFELCWRFYNPALAAAVPPNYKSTATFRPTPQVNIKRTTDLEEGIGGWLKNLVNSARARGDKNGLAHDMTAYSTTTRDQIAESEIDVSSNEYLRSGGRYIQTVNIIGNGDSTYAGMSEGLLRSLNGHHVYYILDMHHLYQPDVRKKLIAAAKDMTVATTDTSLGTPDITNMAKLDSISQTLYRYNNSEESVFEFGLSVVLMTKTLEEMEQLRETTRSQLSMMGGNKVIIGTAQNVPQYIDALGPMNGRDNAFMFQNMSENVSHFIPLTGPFSGSRKPVAIYRNRMGGLTGINPEDGTLNYGMLIIGSAGSGKTFFSQGYMSRVAAMNAEIIAVDMKSDYTASIGGLGGQIIPFYPGERVTKEENGRLIEVPIRYNAFELDEGETRPDEEQKLFLLGFITILLGENELSSAQRAIVTAAIDEVYKRNLDIDLQGKEHLTPVTLSQFVNALQNLNAVQDFSLRDYAEGQSVVQGLVLALQTYTGEQVMGTFLDGESTINLNNKYLYFDLSKMADQPEIIRIALMIIIRVMWKRAKLDRKTIKLCVIEEIGVLFKIPAALNFVAKIYKLGRAYRMWPVAITQEIEDFRLGKGLINNTSQIIVGKVSPEEAQTIADVLRLNEASLNLIHSLGGQKGVYREYLALSVKESGTVGDVVRYFPSSVEYWTYTSTPEEAVIRENLTKDLGGNVTEAIRRLAGAI